MARASTPWTADLARQAARMAGSTEAIVTIDAGAADERRALEGAGFRVSRSEITVELGVARALIALATARLPTGIGARSAAEVDTDDLRHLDDELRQDVPGTSGWRSTAEEFRDDTFTDAFDPRTYLVAVDETTGELVGIVRIWMNRAGPRIGLWGVRRGLRRHGIAAALLAQALGALGPSRPTVVTDYDVTNTASAALVAKLGGRETGRVLELSRG